MLASIRLLNPEPITRSPLVTFGGLGAKFVSRRNSARHEILPFLKANDWTNPLAKKNFYTRPSCAKHSLECPGQGLSPQPVVMAHSTLHKCGANHVAGTPPRPGTLEQPLYRPPKLVYQSARPADPKALTCAASACPRTGRDRCSDLSAAWVDGMLGSNCLDSKKKSAARLWRVLGGTLGVAAI